MNMFRPPPHPDQQFDRLAQGIAAVVAAAVALTCATTGTIEPVAVSAAPRAASAELPPVVRTADGPAIVRPSASASPATTSRPRLSLADFYTALNGLATGRRQESVRVVWLGDSHTAADFMTHEVRRRLQQRFGNGGPGFIRLGVIPYRHGRAKIQRNGKWLRLPLAPAKETPTDDGVFGVGGMRSSPQGRDGRCTVELYRGAVVGEARYDIGYRLPTVASSFEVDVDDQEPVRVSGRDGSGREILHVKLSGRPEGEIRIDKPSGNPELFSVDVLSGTPGVVLDTVGIDGARVATLLAWDGATWVRELSRRTPALIVVAFGTNEVYQEWPVERYGPQYEALLARIESATPDVPCIFMGPTDVMRGGGTDPRVVEIDSMQRAAATRLGCAYVSLFEMMGGSGAYSNWMSADPPLAGHDGVHLTPAGYKKLGAEISNLILDDYEKLYGG